MTDDENGPDRSAPPAPPQTWPVQPPAWGTPPASPGPVADPAPPAQPAQPAPPPAPEWAYAAPPSAWQSAPPPAPPGQLPPWGAPVGAPQGPSTARTVGIILGVTAALVVAVVAAALVLWRPWDGVTPVADPGPRPSITGEAPTPLPDPDGGATPAPVPTEPALPPQALESAAAKAYVKRANAYCRATTDPALKKAFAYADSDPERFLTEAARINRELDTYLRKDVPDEISDNVAGITKDWDTFAAEYEKGAKAYVAGDLETAGQRLAAGEAANRDGNAKARQIGLSDCADAGGLGGGPAGGGASPGVTA
ncbi:hypothetical protein [Kineosporia sp. R_H_3]|uniref:hypothetical protein n=1 Tax=Kineosporia sp. R_H_3 TaxID=1961848 RepID=UPI000B4AA501|nr:hypothetical protein [Kineosporia sp. R_H_3]